nr:MAG TPA: hypothetical protein [Caudoviricetes sp.]
MIKSKLTTLQGLSKSICETDIPCRLHSLRHNIPESNGCDWPTARP